MKMTIKAIAAITLTILLAASCQGQSQGQARIEMRELTDWRIDYSQEQVETAVLAGGCFWGVEGIYEQIQGVLDVRSGYAGGDADSASYGAVGTGRTGHAEAVEIVYDPGMVSYKTLLEVFFTIAHDPTELNRQGPDVGPQYRSAVFYKDSNQERMVRESIAELEAGKLYSDPVVTEVSRLANFYPAEEYHQDFMRLNPHYPYIVHWDLPKLQSLYREYPELVAEGR